MAAPASRSWRQAILVAAASATLASSLMALPPWRLVELRLFDILSTIPPPAPLEPGVVIVAIDEPSFAEIGRQWPWPRDLHARLVQSLRAAGAASIGLDLIFAEPSTPAADGALAASLGPDVVLAADETRIDTPQAEQVTRVEPLPAFTAGGARSGVVAVALDQDGTLRRLPPYPDGFAARLLRAGEGTRQENEPDNEPATIPSGALVQFLG